MIEGVESGTHGTQSNRIQGQTGEVICDHDRGIRALSGPFHNQLRGDIIHF